MLHVITGHSEWLKRYFAAVVVELVVVAAAVAELPTVAEPLLQLPPLLQLQPVVAAVAG